jgi:hypothetical protein
MTMTTDHNRSATVTKLATSGFELDENERRELDGLLEAYRAARHDLRRKLLERLDLWSTGLMARSQEWEQSAQGLAASYRVEVLHQWVEALWDADDADEIDLDRLADLGERSAGR